MQDSVVQQVKERLDIVEVVSGYLKLQKTGINYRAVCPFHSEKKPSFFVSPTRQSWKCFGCSEGGSVFDFIMKIEGIEFGDALRVLAPKAGVELKTYKPEMKTERSRLYEILELSCRFFEKQVNQSSKGREAKSYLLERGLNEESIKKWRLGYSPETWHGLSDFLVGKGYGRDEIIKAGLAVQKTEESSKSQSLTSELHSYDRFRGRIIFPVFDLNSQVIGFGARVFKAKKEEEVAKYINTPNTLLYNKSSHLYGLNFAKIDIRKKDSAVLAEGYLDVILAHQVGYSNTVGTSGTALTFNHLKILKRYTQKLLTAFDMDLAGDLATKKGIDLAQRQDFEIKVINMPQDKDPADIIKESPEKWQELVGSAQDILDFYFENAFSKFDKESPLGKKEISKMLLPKIKEIPNRILQAHWVSKLAKAIKIGEEAIFDELKRLVVKKEESLPSEEETVEASLARRSFSEGGADKARKEILEERVLSCCLKEPKNLELISQDLLPFFSSEMKIIFSTLSKLGKSEKNLEKLKKGQDNIKKILDDALLISEIEDFEKEEIELCLSELKKIDLKNKLENLSKEINLAEEEGDSKKAKNLIEEFNQMVHKLNLY